MLFSEVVEARGLLPRDKAGSQEDQVVAEMVLELSWNEVEMVRKYFDCLIRGGQNSEEEDFLESWKKFMLYFIPKVSDPKKFSDWRGIAVISVMLKWFLQCVMVQGKKLMPAQADLEDYHFGFREGHRCNMIADSIRGLLARATEWAN